MLTKLADGRTDLVFELLAQGGAARAVDANGGSLIKWCAYYGDVSAIRYLLLNGEALASLGENFDLNGAAFHGHWRLCQFLIESGADVNFALPSTLETALHAAASVANRPANDLVIQVLLAAGADPNRVTCPGAETGCFMRDTRTKGETPLHRAAAFSSERAVQSLIDAGADIAAKDAAGDTPLSWASWHQRPAAILRRLVHGAHVINPHADWNGDHGAGWRGMDMHLLGTPHT
jgi:ankyrin repeat protein